MYLNTFRIKVLTTRMAGGGGAGVLAAPEWLYGFCQLGLDPSTLRDTGAVDAALETRPNCSLFRKARRQQDNALVYGGSNPTPCTPPSARALRK